MSDLLDTAGSPSSLDIQAMEAEHAKWLASGGKEGKRANFRGLDFSGIDLSGRQLMEASLRGANFTNANLSKIDLRAADLSEAQLDGANLTDAQLGGASLVRAKLRKANAAGADLVTANFTAVHAEEINLAGAKLNAAVFRDGNFRRANLAGALLRDANLRSVMLEDANLTNADLTASDCRDASLDRVNFTNAILKNANCKGARFSGVDMKATDFSTALDVAAEVMAKAVQTERNKFIEEQAQIDGARADLVQREASLASEIKSVQDEHTALLSRYTMLQRRLSSFCIGFILRGLLWLCFAGGILGFTLYISAKTQHLNTPIFLSFTGGAVFAMLLALWSMLRSFQAARLIRQFNNVSRPLLKIRNLL